MQPTPRDDDSGDRVLVVAPAAMVQELSQALGGELELHHQADLAGALRALATERYGLAIVDGAAVERAGRASASQLKGQPGSPDVGVLVMVERAALDADPGSADPAFADGADDYLVRPFVARELAARIRGQLRFTQLRREHAAAAARERSNEDLERLQALAVESSRAKDQFLAMLGHELRNPLSPIVTTLQVMRLRGQHSPDLDLLERQVAHLTRLVDDLLDVSRITRGRLQLRPRRVEVAELVRRALEVASPLLEQSRHEVVVEVAERHLQVRADVDRMVQVLANLVTNAAKYSAPGTRIDIAAHRAGESIRIAVRDRGAGIPPELLGSIFDMFSQQPQALARSRGGLGLGLAIVRSLVELHGGSVAVSSEPGVGSELVVELPALVTATPTGPLMPVMRSWSCAEGCRILVVDDNEDGARGMQSVLVELGCPVRIAFDGPSALEVARTFQPSIALLDIGLPAMDGYELAQRMRAVVSGPLQLIAVTGYGQEGDRERASAAGFDRHLVKPVPFDVLERLLEELASA